MKYRAHARSERDKSKNGVWCQQQQHSSTAAIRSIQVSSDRTAFTNLPPSFFFWIMCLEQLCQLSMSRNVPQDLFFFFGLSPFFILNVFSCIYFFFLPSPPLWIFSLSPLFLLFFPFLLSLLHFFSLLNLMGGKPSKQQQHLNAAQTTENMSPPISTTTQTASTPTVAIDGRVYHNIESSSYCLPRDEDEQDRLNSVCSIGSNRLLATNPHTMKL